MYKNGQGIGVGGSQFFRVSAYTKFTAPIFYSNQNVPDSCQISITLGNSPGQFANTGSYFILDDLAFEGTLTDVDDIENSQPEYFSLEQNYPNPFNSTTTIAFQSGEVADAEVIIYNWLGEKVTNLFKGKTNLGENYISWNGKNDNNKTVASGPYFYVLKLAGKVYTKKMIFVK